MFSIDSVINMYKTPENIKRASTLISEILKNKESTELRMTILALFSQLPEGKQLIKDIVKEVINE